jgi:hypothetical protein
MYLFFLRSTQEHRTFNRIPYEVMSGITKEKFKDTKGVFRRRMSKKDQTM